MKKALLSLTILLTMFSNAYAEVDPTTVAKKKQTPQGKYLTAKEAYEMVVNEKDDVMFIDVRTRAETQFVGMTHIVDTNIPYMVADLSSWNEDKDRFAMSPNSNFALSFEEAMFEKNLDQDSKVIVMCRSGSRSAKAANMLSQMGYDNVYSVVDGFEGDKAKTGPYKGHRVMNGWKNSNLPWSYKLAKSKMNIE